MMMRFIKFPGLYAISPEQKNTAILVAQVQAAIKGGVRLVQYRNKTLSSALRIEQAQALRQLCYVHDALLLINDDVELAKTCAADGVHLGQSDKPMSEARVYLGPKAIIGVTCHDSLDFAKAAAGQGADYLSFGCFFPSHTKPKAKPAHFSILKQAKEQFQLPIVAIGGITAENAPLLLQAGADLLAICNSLFAQADITQAAQNFIKKV
jgi:thiamine-phosphate pyrophosphorylase